LRDMCIPVIMDFVCTIFLANLLFIYTIYTRKRRADAGKRANFVQTPHYDIAFSVSFAFLKGVSRLKRRACILDEQLKVCLVPLSSLRCRLESIILATERIVTIS